VTFQENLFPKSLVLIRLQREKKKVQIPLSCDAGENSLPQKGDSLASQVHSDSLFLSRSMNE
jgi:hypothetical protein